MDRSPDIAPALLDALAAIDTFITAVTGQKPSAVEIADALKRYFVLNEIKAHIVMARKASEASPTASPPEKR